MKYDEINYKNVAAQPSIISEIIKIDADSSNCCRELDKLLRSDQSAMSLVLRVVNSPIYNRGMTIKTLPVAISILGINVIRSLAMLALSRSIFASSQNQLIRRHIWNHSLLTAIASQLICNKLNGTEVGEDGEEGEEAFVAGLLHDIGKVLLFSNYAEEYMTVLNYILENNCASAEAEQRILGTDHYEVGRQAVKEWKLPEHFVNYTGTNLDSLSTPNKVQQSLAAANSLIKGAGFGSSSWDLCTRKAKLLALGLSNELSEYLLEDTFMQGLMGNELYLQCTK